MSCCNAGVLRSAVVACGRRCWAPQWRTILRLAAGLTLVVAGCAPPIRVARVDPLEVERQLDSNVIATQHLSEATRIVLHRAHLLARFATDPEDALASLHHTLATEPADPEVLFALAEMSFLQALRPGQQPHALAAAVYAYAFLFPADPHQRPSGFDPRMRTACDIYNRSLIRAFASADRTRFDVQSGRYPLAFGSLDVTFDPTGAHWGDQLLSNFTPADELRITGLPIRYRRPGIGASLAADATPPVQEHGFQVEPNVKVPVTALLRIAEAEGERRARIRLERDHLSRNRHVAGFEGRIDLQAPAQGALRETVPSSLNPQQRGHRDLDVGFNLETVFLHRRGGIGGQRRADPRPAIADLQASDAQLVGGRKVG